MSNIKDDFEATMVAVQCDEFRDSTMVKTSLRIPAELLSVIDWVSSQLGTSRQNVIVKILDWGVDEAFYGVCKGQGSTIEHAKEILEELKQTNPSSVSGDE